jgi:type IV secretory pathway VirB10-like protein
MAEIKKIIIPTGDSPDESLPTPHFDAEATLTARPVIPLTEQEKFRMQHGGYVAGAQTPFWKRPALLALIVLVAIGVGVAAGLTIGIYRNRSAAQAPVASEPPSTSVENAKVDQPVIEQPVPQPTRQARADVPETTVETPAEPKAEERDRNERNDERVPVRNERKRDDNDVAPPVVVRDKKRDRKAEDDDGEVFNDRQAERERRREDRRERRRRGRDEEDAIDIPRQIERAGRNRIREIFEGRQP